MLMFLFEKLLARLFPFRLQIKSIDLNKGRLEHWYKHNPQTRYEEEREY